MTKHQTALASIDPATLRKGDRIPGDTAWNFYASLRPDKMAAWLSEHGGEELARAAHLSQALLAVRDWIDARRRNENLPPLVLTTGGKGINVLTDEEASRYLSDQAFSGLRKHARSTGRLIAAVDRSNLSSMEAREHEGRVRVHSFILSSTQGAQAQLRKLREAGYEPPRVSPSPEG